MHEEIDNIRKEKHGARSARQAIAIGLSEARRAGVDLKPPKKEPFQKKSVEVQKALTRKGKGMNLFLKRAHRQEKKL